MGVDEHKTATQMLSQEKSASCPPERKIPAWMQAICHTPTKDPQSFRQFAREHKHVLTTKYPFLSNSQIGSKLRFMWRKYFKKSPRLSQSMETLSTSSRYLSPSKLDFDDVVGSSGGLWSPSDPHVVRRSELGCRTYKVHQIFTPPRIISKSPGRPLNSILTRSNEKKINNRVRFDEQTSQPFVKSAKPSTLPDSLMTDYSYDPGLNGVEKDPLSEYDMSDSDEDREQQLTSLHDPHMNKLVRRSSPMKSVNKIASVDRDGRNDSKHDVYSFDSRSDEGCCDTYLSDSDEDRERQLLCLNALSQNQPKRTKRTRGKTGSRQPSLSHSGKSREKRQRTITSMFKTLQTFGQEKGKCKDKDLGLDGRQDELQNQPTADNSEVINTPMIVERSSDPRSTEDQGKKITDHTPCMSPSILAKTLQKSLRTPRKKRQGTDHLKTHGDEVEHIASNLMEGNLMEDTSLKALKSPVAEELELSQQVNLSTHTGGSSPTNDQKRRDSPCVKSVKIKRKSDLPALPEMSATKNDSLQNTPAKNTRGSVRENDPLQNTPAKNTRSSGGENYLLQNTPAKNMRGSVRENDPLQNTPAKNTRGSLKKTLCDNQEISQNSSKKSSKHGEESLEAESHSTSSDNKLLTSKTSQPSEKKGKKSFGSISTTPLRISSIQMNTDQETLEQPSGNTSPQISSYPGNTETGLYEIGNKGDANYCENKGAPETNVVPSRMCVDVEEKLEAGSQSTLSNPKQLTALKISCPSKKDDKKNFGAISTTPIRISSIQMNTDRKTQSDPQSGNTSPQIPFYPRNIETDLQEIKNKGNANESENNFSVGCAKDEEKENIVKAGAKCVKISLGKPLEPGTPTTRCNVRITPRTPILPTEGLIPCTPTLPGTRGTPIPRDDIAVQNFPNVRRTPSRSPFQIIRKNPLTPIPPGDDYLPLTPQRRSTTQCPSYQTLSQENPLSCTTGQNSPRQQDGCDIKPIENEFKVPHLPPKRSRRSLEAKALKMEIEKLSEVTSDVSCTEKMDCNLEESTPRAVKESENDVVMKDEDGSEPQNTRQRPEPKKIHIESDVAMRNEGGSESYYSRQPDSKKADNSPLTPRRQIHRLQSRGPHKDSDSEAHLSNVTANTSTGTVSKKAKNMGEKGSKKQMRRTMQFTEEKNHDLETEKLGLNMRTVAMETSGADSVLTSADICSIPTEKESVVIKNHHNDIMVGNEIIEASISDMERCTGDADSQHTHKCADRRSSKGTKKKGKNSGGQMVSKDLVEDNLKHSTGKRAVSNRKDGKVIIDQVSKMKGDTIDDSNESQALVTGSGSGKDYLGMNRTSGTSREKKNGFEEEIFPVPSIGALHFPLHRVSDVAPFPGSDSSEEGSPPLSCTPGQSVLEEVLRNMRKIVSPDILGLDKLEEYDSSDIFSPLSSPFMDDFQEVISPAKDIEDQQNSTTQPSKANPKKRVELQEDPTTSRKGTLRAKKADQPISMTNEGDIRENLPRTTTRGEGKEFKKYHQRVGAKSQTKQEQVLGALFDEPHSPNKPVIEVETPRSASRRLVRSEKDKTKSNFMDLFSPQAAAIFC